jgi:hypothetical protein
LKSHFFFCPANLVIGRAKLYQVEKWGHLYFSLVAPAAGEKALWGLRDFRKKP